MFKSHTRIKFALLMVFLGLIEALIKAAWAPFPFFELLSFQSGIYLGYSGLKTANNQAAIKNGGSRVPMD